MNTNKVETIDEYIAGFSPEIQVVLKQVRETIRKKIPEAVEMISYGIPTFKLNKSPVIYFAGYKNHVGVYPIPTGDAVFEKEIASFKKGKGTLQFPHNKPIPIDLITKVVALRLKENAERSKRKK